MTEQQANLKLLKKEYDYFNHFSEKCETIYCAVVKRSNDYSISDDYYIEIGLTNYTVLTDPKYKALDALAKQSMSAQFISDAFKDDYFRGNVNPVNTQEAVLLSNSLKHDKITGGCSVFYESSANRSGTAGAFFKLKHSQDIFLLSNRHVIVDPDFEENTCVVHPSRQDSSDACPNEIIGKIHWTSAKDDDLLDAAVAILDYPVDIGRYTLCHSLKFNSLGEASLHQNVSKYGRSSGMTYGEIRSINCTVNITGRIEKPRFFRQQLLSTNLAIDGDSGSVLVNTNEEVVGLIFASNRNRASFSNNIKYIFNKPKIRDFSKFV